MPDMTPIEALRFDITGTVLSSDDSGTQVLESLAMDQALATLLLAEQTAALVEQQTRTADALEAANLIAYLGVATQHRLAYQPGENVLKAVQSGVEIRLGLA